MRSGSPCGLIFESSVSHRAFQDRLDEVRAQGYDEAFIRLWEYYLCYCEAGFAERYIGVVQAQFDKPLCRRDPIAVADRAARATLAEMPQSHHSKQQYPHRKTAEPARIG